jgi:hypothetical protein
MVWRLAWGKRPDRDAVLQQVFGPQDSDPASALDRFLARVGVSSDFKDHGVTPQEAQDMLERAMQGPRGRNFIQSAAA